MKPITKALHSRAYDAEALPSVTPLYQCSAFEAGSPYFYTRKNNPNVAEFEAVIASLEGARHAVAMTCGMAAIAAVLQLLSPGEKLVVNKDIYGCSYKLFQRVTAHMRLEMKILDLSLESSLDEIPAATRMVVFETPTNPFLKAVDIAAISRKVKEDNPRALVVVDNTWATPLFQHPLELGADLSLHSATKYFSGHSDVMGGIVLMDRDDLHDELRNARFYNGAILDPHSAWLLRRSMQTFQIRMKQHQEVTTYIRDFLATLPQVTRVYYPEVDGRQLKGYGTLIFFELRPDLIQHYPLFTENLQLFTTGTGMACVTSMVAQPYTGSHASMTDDEKREMGLGRGLIRLSLGLEDPDDLKNDLAQAFAAIDREPAEAAALGYPQETVEPVGR